MELARDYVDQLRASAAPDFDVDGSLEICWHSQSPHDASMLESNQLIFVEWEAD